VLGALLKSTPAEVRDAVAVGLKLGKFVMVGKSEGAFVGSLVGSLVGFLVGSCVG